MVTTPQPLAPRSTTATQSHISCPPAVRRGEVFLQTRSHTAWGAAVTAQILVPLPRTLVWQRVVDYARWVDYFPDLTHSEVCQNTPQGKLIYQTASKQFLCFKAEVEIYLQVVETVNRQIRFHLHAGSFHDFFADLSLQQYEGDTLITYAVQATPKIPVPSMFIQQAIHFDLPHNMKHMRRQLLR